MNTDEKLELRRRHVGPSLSLAYERPLDIIRGDGAHLFDVEGRRYLDLVNNVCGETYAWNSESTGRPHADPDPGSG